MEIRQKEEKLEVYEFQGEFENIDLFNGQLDRESLKMYFSGFSLQGKRVHKELTIFEQVNQEIVQVGKVDEVVLFDLPPRYDIRFRK